MKLEGTIEAGLLAEVLLSLGGERSTGILTVQGEQEIVGLSLLEGSLVSADALNQGLEESLGEILTRRGLVSGEVLANLGAEHQAGGGRVLDLLVERDYLARDELLEALREHIVRLASQVLAWRQGDYKFYRGEEVSHEEGIRPLGVEELLLRCAREPAGKGVLPAAPPERTTVFELAPERAPDAGELAAEELGRGLASAPARREAGELLRRIDGRVSAAELVLDSGLSEHRVLLLLCYLQAAGLIRPRAATAPTAQEPRPKFKPAPAPAGAPAPVPKASVLRAPEADEPPAVAATAPPPPRRRIARRAAPLIAAAGPWPSRLFGLALIAVVAWQTVGRPHRLLLPFPWQGGVRAALELQQREALSHRIEEAARTFFLLEGRFPEELETLVSRGLLPAAATRDPSGGEIGYSATAASLSLQAAGSADGAPARTVTIFGDFLLDPEFVSPEATERSPLVLLD